MGNYKNKKKQLNFIAKFLCVFFAVLLMAPMIIVSAAENEVDNVIIDVDVRKDGSAIIKEVWSVDVRDAGTTEWYLVKDNMDNQQITDFVVTDENGTVFQDIGEWDSDVSMDEKTNKSGLITKSDGYELCWGVGTHDKHKFTIQYRLTNLVKGYEGADAITHNFISEMSMDIETVSIRIFSSEAKFSAENSGIWLFGSDSVIEFSKGEVVANSPDVFRSNYRMGILMKMPDGVFSPLDVRNENFEDIKDRAFDGSDYDKNAGSNSVFSSIRGIINAIPRYMFVLVPAAIIGLFSSYSTRKEKMRPEYKTADYCRKTPFDGSLNATYTRLKRLGQLENDSVIIGAYLLKWVKNGQIGFVKQTAGIFKQKEEDALVLHPAKPMESLEKELYAMLLQAAGADNILQSQEFEKWSKNNYSRVMGWQTNYDSNGHVVLCNQGVFGADNSQKSNDIFDTTRRKEVLSENGILKTVEMFGFKKYLSDFTIVNEREAREVQLWGDYLIFAQLFGIAETVAKQFKDVYPDFFVNSNFYSSSNSGMYDIIWITHMTRHYSNAMNRGYRNGYSAAQQATRSSGGGGGGSFGGGGGFSGGGGGGGR